MKPRLRYVTLSTGARVWQCWLPPNGAIRVGRTMESAYWSWHGSLSALQRHWRL